VRYIPTDQEQAAESGYFQYLADFQSAEQGNAVAFHRLLGQKHIFDGEGGSLFGSKIRHIVKRHPEFELFRQAHQRGKAFRGAKIDADDKLP
jgi:hypothetical protein